MLVFFAVFLFITLFKVRLIKKSAYDKIDNLSDKNVQCIKGVCAVFIVFYNLGLYFFNFQNRVLHSAFNFVGPMAISIFFFLSGYELIKGYHQKGEKFLRELLVKIPLLYLQLVIANFITCAFFYKDMGWQLLPQILGFDMKNTLNPYSWIIGTLLVAHIAFLIIFAISRKRREEGSATFSFVVIMILLCLLPYILEGFGVTGYTGFVRALICLPIGVIYFSHKDTFDECIKNNIAFFVLLSLLFAAIGFAFDLPFAIYIASCLFVVYFGYYFTYANFVTLFLGKISTGMILFHGLYVQHFQNKDSNNARILFGVFVMTVLLATGYYVAMTIIKFVIKQLRKLLKFED